MPGLRTVSGKPVLIPVAARKNLATNPSFEVNLAGWDNRWYGPSGGGTWARVTGVGVTGSGAVARKTWTTAANSADAGISLSPMRVTPGLPYSWSGWMRSSVANNASIYIEWTNAAGTATSSLPYPWDAAASVPMPANTWVRMSMANYIAPPDAVTARFVLTPYANAADMPIGAYLDFDNLCIEQAPTVGAYFDGDTPPDTTTVYGWTGAAGVSTAEAYTKRVLRWLDSDGTTWRTLTEVPQRVNLCTNPSFEVSTAGWNPDTSSPTMTASTDRAMFGTKSLKAVGTSANADVAVATNVGGLLPGQTYRASWWVYPVGTARTASFDWVIPSVNGSAAGGANGYGTVTAPADTWTRVIGTLTVPTNAAPTNNLQFYLHHRNGPATVGQIIYVDGVCVELDSTWNGTYFDGSTSRTNLLANPSLETNLTGWGFNNASSSVRDTLRACVGTASAKTVAIACAGGFGPYVYDVAISAGETYTGSMWVYNDRDRQIHATLEWKANASTRLGTASGATILCKAGTWTQVAVTAAAPATATLATLTAYTTTTTEAGAVMYADAALLEKSPTVGSFFQGTTNDDGDYRYVWSSTPNASTSLALP